MHHPFLYISFPLIHDYDMKMPNFTFYGVQTSEDEILFLFLNLSVVPKKSTPEKFAYIRHFQQIGIIASPVKFEKR